MVFADTNSLLATVGIDTIDFETGMDRVKDKVDEIEVSTKQLGRSLLRFGAILTAFGGGVLLSLTKMAQKAAEAMGDTTFTDAMQAFQDALDALMFTIGEAAL